MLSRDDWGGRCCFASPNLTETYWLYGGQGRARQGRADRDNSDSGWNLGVVRPVRSDWGQTGTADSIHASFIYELFKSYAAPKE